MKIKHNCRTGKTDISLSWVETRQFTSVKSVREFVGVEVAKVISGDFTKGHIKTVEVPGFNALYR